MTTNELAQLGTTLVNDAQARDIALRMFGGVAIYARCPSIESNQRLQRENKDLDFVVAVDAWTRVSQVFTDRGFVPADESANELRYTQDKVMIKVFQPRLHQDFTLDFTSRLSITPLTLSLADLLLQKLARINFVVEDIQDSAVLLVDHRVTDGGDEAEEINRGRLYHIANNDYRLWKTVFDNTVTLEKTFDQYLEPEQAQLAWRRIELVQEVLDGKSHSFGWWAGRVFAG